MSFAAEEFEGKTVKSLKTLVSKQIGVSRFRQRWLCEDHTELREDALVCASDVQLVVLEFVQAEDGEVEKLFDACKVDDSDAVEKLLRKPLSPNIKNEYSETALHIAASFGSIKCLALLLEAGADKDAVAMANSTALHLAADNGHLEVVRLLLDAVADTDATDDFYGRTALHLAAMNGHLEIVRLLLGAGTDKDATDAFCGDSAWNLATKNGHQDVAQLLE